MKKIVIVLALCLLLIGCGKVPGPSLLTATVVDIQDRAIVVLPMRSGSERTPANLIQVSTALSPDLEVEVGDTVRIEYQGSLTETSPMQLENVQSIALVWHDPQVTTIPPTEPEILTLPQRLEMTFRREDGSWSTDLRINVDGSFSGSFQQANQEEVGEDYPNGTVRYCDFQGRFQITAKLGNDTYALTLSELRSQQQAGEQSIHDDTLYISATPYGLEGGSDFNLYTPQTPVSQLSSSFLAWWPGSTADPCPDVLGQWGLHNLFSDVGFFTASAS